ncbi:MAG: TIGR03016 family PEP-CTERM system-associated outer membrane protein [Desulfovibrio sp.]|nr:TIGR03016 family PEP-CTERM system-associated outer membrane protein [Desulfovibrio sp.]
MLTLSKKAILIQCTAAMLVLALCLPAQAADFQFKPRISATTEYNDNVEEVNGGKGDTVAIVKPGLSATYDHSRIFLDLSYDFELKEYMDDVRDDEQNHYLDGFLKVEAIKDLFFVEVSDTFKKQYEDSTRGELEDGETTNGTTDQNIFTVKPYFVFDFNERTFFTTGAEFNDIWYSEEGNIDKRNARAFVDVTHELTDRWELLTGAGYMKQDARFVEEGGFDRYDVTLGTKYTYAEDSFVEAIWYPTYTEYESAASNDQGNPYKIGVTHALSGTMVGKLYSEMDFTEDPQSADTQETYSHSAELRQQYERGYWNIGLRFNDYRGAADDEHRRYWRPSFDISHDLTGRLTIVGNAYAEFDVNDDYDTYYFLRTGLQYAIAESLNTTLSYRLKNNEENGNSRDYTSNTVGLTLSWTY